LQTSTLTTRTGATEAKRRLRKIRKENTRLKSQINFENSDIDKERKHRQKSQINFENSDMLMELKTAHVNVGC
jgi:hypothetical protein